MTLADVWYVLQMVFWAVIFIGGFTLAYGRWPKQTMVVWHIAIVLYVWYSGIRR